MSATAKLQMHKNVAFRSLRPPPIITVTTTKFDNPMIAPMQEAAISNRLVAASSCWHRVGSYPSIIARNVSLLKETSALDFSEQKNFVIVLTFLHKLSSFHFLCDGRVCFILMLNSNLVKTVVKKLTKSIGTYSKIH